MQNKTGINVESILPEKIIEERRRKVLEKKDFVFFIEKLLLVILVLLYIFTNIYGLGIVDGQDMYPSIKDGDLALFFRINNSYQIGDVIIFKKGAQYISRIVAKSGDVVDITDTGELVVNGNIQQEEIYFATFKDLENDFFPYTVGSNAVFVLGDYRTVAKDSRLFGEVKFKEIEGKIISVLHRRGI